jgi:hypothetical protein
VLSAQPFERLGEIRCRAAGLALLDQEVAMRRGQSVFLEEHVLAPTLPFLIVVADDVAQDCVGPDEDRTAHRARRKLLQNDP